MLFFRKPSLARRADFQAAQRALTFTYAAVGTTAGLTPAGYNLDHTRIKLGQGEAVYHAARRALESWQQFQLGWVEPWPADTPLRVGEVVTVAVRTFGVWTLNACRIVYIVSEEGPLTKFGFAYGTLPGHAETGEERFLVEWDRADDAVWYDIRAFSRPRHLLARLGHPVVRRLQKRFGRDSAAAMSRASALARTKA
ncbi:MAG: DUF1990 domain-containing protein [Planctomycetia bacterium]|nr:DUF1990 domain-containing protein [Planctomycetia bacterium]